MTTKKRSQRSPAYPIVGLNTAIDKLEAYYGEEGQNIVSRDAAIESMGYTSASGQSLQMMSTLIQYDLLEKTGAGQVKISDIGLAIMAGLDDDKQEAILQAAVSPPIFAELKDSFPLNKPSVRAITSHLIQRKPKGYNQKSANKISKAFHDTIEFANLYGKDYNGTSEETENVVPLKGEAKVRTSATGNLTASSGKQAILPLPEGEVMINFPQYELSEASVGILKDWIDLILRIKEPSKEPEES